MMRPLKTFLLAIFVLAVFCAINQTLMIARYGKRADYSQPEFQRSNPSAKLKILIVGDSTAVGTGTRSKTQSTAGWFGQDFPQAHIVNISRNGLKLDGLLAMFRPNPGEHYDLAVAQIGANDIIHLTPFPKIKERIAQVIDRLRPLAGTVVILHSGNIGTAPIFTWPVSDILSWRSRKVREIYIQAAREKGALYVDLYAERANDLLIKDIDRYYAPDHFHLSGDGYRHWYDRIRETLAAAGVGLE